MKKKILSFFLTIVLVAVNFIPLPASASTIASGTCGENLTWELDDEGTLTISGIGKMGSNNMFPEDYGWYDHSNMVRHVIITEGVTSVGMQAFAFAYENLTEVTIGSDVQIICSGAFTACTNLRSISLSESVITVEQVAFSGCANLADVYYTGSTAQWEQIIIENNNEELINATAHMNSTVVIASGTCGENLIWELDDEGTLTIYGTGPMENYDQYARSPWFNYRNSVYKIIIGAKVTTIGDNAFTQSLITEITIPDSVTTIGTSAFSYCNQLKDITIGNSVQTIGNSAFLNCYNLLELDLPNSVTTIENGAFSGCSQVTEVTIPDNVTVINSSVFSECLSLKKITLPEKLTCIEECAFSRNDTTTGLLYSLTDVYYKGTINQWKQVVIKEYKNEAFLEAALHTEPLVAAVLIGEQKFETLEKALEAVKSGDTIQLQMDVEADAFFLWSGITLDLNGCKLTANGIAASFVGANIIDSSEAGTGLLVVPENAFSYHYGNAQLILKTTEGYRFADAMIKQQLTLNESTYTFSLGLENNYSGMCIAELIQQYGAENLSLQFQVKIDWEGANGTLTQFFCFKNETVKEFADVCIERGSYKGRMNMDIINAIGLDNLTFTGQLVVLDAKGMVIQKISGEPIPAATVS